MSDLVSVELLISDVISHIPQPRREVSTCVEIFEQSLLCPFVLLGCLFESPRTSCSFLPTSSLLILHCPSGSPSSFNSHSSAFPLPFPSYSAPLSLSFPLLEYQRTLGRNHTNGTRGLAFPKASLFVVGLYVYVCACVYVLGIRGGWPKEPKSSQTIAPLGTEG